MNTQLFKDLKVLSCACFYHDDREFAEKCCDKLMNNKALDTKELSYAMVLTNHYKNLLTIAREITG